MKYERYKEDHLRGMNHMDAPDMIGAGECQDAVNLYQLETGWLRGRLGSTAVGIDETHFDWDATNVRFIWNYDTDIGTPDDGKPGVTSDGARYQVVFMNTKNGTDEGGAIAVLDWNTFAVIQGIMQLQSLTTTQDIIWEAGDATTGVPNAVLSTDHTTFITRLSAESVLIPKGSQAHGKLYIPLPKNKLLSLWVENDVWHCEQLAVRLPDIDTVLIDARVDSTQENYGPVAGPLVLSQWVPPQATALKQTTAYSDTIGLYGSAGNPIVNRADDSSGQTFLNAAAKASEILRDATKPLQRFDSITVNYYPRTSPITGIGYQSAKDIFYRPDNQVANFDKNIAPRDVIPESRYGYKFVWEYQDGTFSNPTTDLWIGDMLWSALQVQDSNNLHSGPFTPVPAPVVYAEDALGLITVGSPHTAIAAHDGSPQTVVVSNAIADLLPAWTLGTAFFLVIREAGVQNIALLTAIGAHDSGGAGYTNLTIYRGQTNDAFTTAATLSTFFDQASTANGHGSWASFDDTMNTLTILKNLKHQLLPSTHTHYDDDCFITTQFDLECSGWSFQFEVGEPTNPRVGATNSPGTDDVNMRPTNYALASTVTGAVMYRMAGWYLNCLNTDNSFTDSHGNLQIASGVRDAHALPVVVKMQTPNLAYITTDGDSIGAFEPSAGAAWPLLVMQGFIDYEFCPPHSNNQTGGFGVLIRYQDDTGVGADYNTPNTGAYYSWRKLIPATRLLWDWQLSQTIPSSAIFGCPRIGLTIKTADVPTNAKRLLIFRTINSLDPAFSSTDYGLVEAVDVPAVGVDLYYFDQVKDGSLDFEDTPDLYLGIKHGVAPRYIQPIGERLVIGNLTEYYSVDAPRAEIENDDATHLLNTSCVFEAYTSTRGSAPDFDGSTGLHSAKYLIVYRDGNGKTSNYKECDLIDRRDSGTDDFIVKGYFLGHGDATIKYLDVYRLNVNFTKTAWSALTTYAKGDQVSDGGALYESLQGTNLNHATSDAAWWKVVVPYLLVKSLVAQDGGIFYDDLVQAALPTTAIDLTQFGGITDIDNFSSFRWSEPLRPEFYIGASLQDVRKGDGEVLTGLDIINSNVMAFKPNAIGEFLIDISLQSGGARFNILTLKEGCIAPCTLFSNGKLLFFLSNLGMRTFDGRNYGQLDKKVYNDIQALCRDTTSLEWFTACFVPRYGAVWLSENTTKNDVTTTITIPVSSSHYFTVDADSYALLPDGEFSFLLDDGMGGTDTGHGVKQTFTANPWSALTNYVIGDVVSDSGVYYYCYAANLNQEPPNGTYWVVLDSLDCVSFSRTSANDYDIGASVTIYNAYANVWVFDDFYAGGEVKESQVVVTRFSFPNQKMFVTRRDGRIISGIIRNPSALNNFDTVQVKILMEDGGYNVDQYADAGVYTLANGQVISSWKSRLLTNDDSLRIKRNRFSRVRIVHETSIVRTMQPIAFTEYYTNAGSGGVIAESTVRYHKAADDRVPYDDNLKFVCQNAQRGIDITLGVEFESEQALFRGIESDYVVLRKDE